MALAPAARAIALSPASTSSDALLAALETAFLAAVARAKDAELRRTAAVVRARDRGKRHGVARG